MKLSESEVKCLSSLKGELSETGKYQQCLVCSKFILVPRLDNHIASIHRKELNVKSKSEENNE